MTVAPKWSSKKAALILIVAAGIGVVSKVLVSATEQAAEVLGLSEFFVGLILIPIIGDAAENSSAIVMAVRNRMDLALNVGIGSSIQVPRPTGSKGLVDSRVCHTRSSLLLFLS